MGREGREEVMALSPSAREEMYPPCVTGHPIHIGIEVGSLRSRFISLSYLRAHSRLFAIALAVGPTLAALPMVQREMARMKEVLSLLLICPTIWLCSPSETAHPEEWAMNLSLLSANTPTRL